MSKTYHVNSQGEVIEVIDHGDDPLPLPDYVGFYSALLNSSVYAGVLAVPATADLTRAMVVFVSAIQDCMAGRENREAMQGAIWLLLSQLPMNAEHAMELQALMSQYNLADIYSLSPSPERARDEEGRFLPGDPSTPDLNEAWVDPT